MQEREQIDLNKVSHHAIFETDELLERDCESKLVQAEFVFNDIAQVVRKEIAQSSIVVGCIAWFTNKSVISTMSKSLEHVQIVVQKQDFLRPDSHCTREDIREAYRSLPFIQSYQDEIIKESLIYKLLDCDDDRCIREAAGDAVRCCGLMSDVRHPLMHHKFAVLFDKGSDTPNRVITGSWNWTKNGEMSYENIIVVRDKTIAFAYMSEYARIYALSEHLDWASQTMNPQWILYT